MNPDDGALWIRRPVICREKGCNDPVIWAVLYGALGVPPRVEGSCAGHADPRWDSEPIITHEALSLMAVEIGMPQTCSLRPRRASCGNPEDHVAIYVDSDGPSFRLGPACSACLQDAGVHIDDGHVLVMPTDELIPFEEAFGPAPPEPWWRRHVVDPSLGEILGSDYVELIERTGATWEALFWAFGRAAVVGIVTVLAMAFVPRSAWWLLIGGVAPFIGLLLGIVAGSYRFGKWSFSDPQSETTFENGEVVTRVDEDPDGGPLEFRLDAVVAVLAFSLVFVAPGVIYAAVLLLAGDWFDTSYGHTVAAAGIWTVAAFVGTGALLAGVVTFCVWFAWNLLIMLPSLFAYWFMGGD